MKILYDFFIVLMDSKYKEETTEAGVKTLNKAYMEDWAEEHLKYRKQYGVVLETPGGYSDMLYDIDAGGLPEPKVFVGGDFIMQKERIGYTTLPQYNPSSFDGFPIITLQDIAKRVDVKKGDKIYFDYLVPSPERYLGMHQGMEMYSVRVDEIYCAVRHSRIPAEDGRIPYEVIPQGLWCMVEPIGETWEQIVTEHGVVTSPRPNIKYLEGIVRHIRDREDVKNGDMILYQRNADYTVTIEDVDYFVMLEDDILCKRT